MESLQYILNLLFPEKANELGALLQYAAKNRFDLNEMLKNLDLAALAPLLGGLFSSPAAENARTGENESAQSASPLTPIAAVADKDIVYCLNRYLSAGEM